MGRMYNKKKSLLFKRASGEDNITDEQVNRSEEELEAICKSKSRLQKTQGYVREVWLLCMEPFM